jgi:hypothetical protein
MLILRATALIAVLAGAGFVNLFLAPQLYTPRPPVFTGPDLASTWEWRGHSFGVNTWWLAENLPNAEYVHVDVDVPDNAADGALEVGILLDDRPARIFELPLDDTRIPVDVSRLDGVRETLFDYEVLKGNIRCQVDTFSPQDGRCDFFVAINGDGPTTEPLTLVGVLTRVGGDGDEMALVEQSLLEEVTGQSINSLTLMGVNQ